MTAKPHYLPISEEELESLMGYSERDARRQAIANEILSRVQPQPFLAMPSPDLIALSEQDWTNRAERKQPAYDKRSWLSGWMEGYFSKPQKGEGK